MIWNTRFMATWLASAVNSMKPVAAISARATIAIRRAGRTIAAGGAAAKAPSSRASIIATEPANRVSATMCPTLADG